MRSVDDLVVRPGAGLFVDVSLSLTDGVVGDDHSSGASEHHSAVEGIPTELIAAMPVDYHDTQDLSVGLLGSIDNCGYHHAVGGLIGYALSHDSLYRGE